jgi:3D (Asp-Asp-Asp) domain-containing protein
MAASNTYAFGTRLLVEGVGVVTVEDRIGWGTDLDLYGPSEAFCRRFGRKHLHVRVVR